LIPLKSSGKELTGVFGYIAGIDANPVTPLYFCNARDFRSHGAKRAFKRLDVWLPRKDESAGWLEQVK
jgi:hypothetical protein